MASIAIALVVAPLVVAAPLIGQNGVQNADLLQVQCQQQLQTGNCVGGDVCDSNVVGKAVQAQDPICTQEQECLQQNSRINCSEYNKTATEYQFKSQDCQQDCIDSQNQNTNCTDNCDTTQQQHSYTYHHQNRHGNRCR